MKLAKDGYSVIKWAIVVAFFVALIGVFVPKLISIICWMLALGIILFTLYFFRDPERNTPPHIENAVLAPADGKIVVIEQVHEPIFLNETAIQLSIFLSPLDVHVNRIPVSGKVAFERYVPGEYLVAWEPKASQKNERSEIGVIHASGKKILFKQIAGFVARRIVYHLKVGDSVEAGNRFGIVKFGSRMDILLPLDTEVKVNLGDKVRAGETLIASILTNK